MIRETLEFLREEGQAAAGPVGGEHAAGSAVTLSWTQKRLWYLHRVLTDPGVLNMGCTLRLFTDVNTSGLQTALQRTVARHGVLRTKFDLERPAGELQSDLALRLEVTDLTEGCADDRLRTAMRMFDENLQRKFDLNQAPLIRSGLIRLGPEDHLLWLVAHPLVFDRFSGTVFLRELQEPSQLPSLPFSYPDFAEWQNTRLAEGAWNEEVDAWRTALPQVLPVLDLPADRARPPVLSYAGETVHRRLRPERVASLRTFAARQNCDLETVLFSAWGALLYRLTGHPSMIVGRVVANRNVAGARQVIGRFERTLPLHLQFAEDLPLSSYLQDVRKAMRDADGRRHVPFEHLIEELRCSRDLSRSPLCQALFSYDEPDIAQGMELGTAGTPTDVSLACSVRAGGVDLSLAFSTDLFENDTAARFLARFETLLETICDYPESALVDLSILPDEERESFSAWNQTTIEFPKKFVHQLFEQNAASMPQRVAVDSVTGSLTYAELDRLANRIAWHLLAQGVGVGSLVGVYMNRTPEIVATLLGILKAGAGYVPLDPAYPRDRLTYVTQGSGIKVVACSRELLPTVPGDGLVCISIDDPEAPWRSGPDVAPPCDVGPEDIAYVLYTSGSTGKPKGVQIPHRAVSNFLHAMQVEPSLTAEDRVLALTTLSFDISVLELFLPLSVGARIVLVDRQTALDPIVLLRRIDDSGVTLMQATPATWRMLLDAGWKGRSDLRVITGGEACSPDLAAQLLKCSDEVWNLYGPTEATVWATAARVESAQRILIGKPIKNTTTYILDRRMRQVPIGVPGELCLGGVQLAAGYRDLPETTAEKFVRNPFSAGELIYRTGDLARFLPDGNIECLGRLDHQVKIRGFRIELGEIESVLLEQDGVEKAVVVAIDDEQGKRLAAYFVARPGVALSLGDLRSGLQQKLPDYMLPAHFVAVDRLPLTPNGKIDRLALPKPEGRAEAAATAVPGRDSLEKNLVEIWQDALNVKPIGIHDDFFRLGGDSLLAVRVMVRIEAAFEKKVPLAVLFQAPTIAQLATVIRERGQVEFSCVVPIQTEGARPPLFLVHGLGGNVLGYHTVASYLRPVQPVYGIQAVGLDGTSTPFDTIHAMAAHYLSEVRQVQPSGPYYLGGLSLGGIIALEMARQLQELGDEVSILVMLDAYAFGVEKLATKSGRTKKKLASVARRATLHVRNLLSLSFEEKMDYIRRKSHTLKRRMQWKLRSGQYKTYLRGADELPETYNAVAHAMWTAMKNYVPSPLNARVLVLRAKDDPFLRNNDPTLGWGQLIDPQPTIAAVPGGHLTFLEEPYASAAAKAILSEIDDIVEPPVTKNIASTDARAGRREFVEVSHQ